MSTIVEEQRVLTLETPASYKSRVAVTEAEVDVVGVKPRRSPRIAAPLQPTNHEPPPLTHNALVVTGQGYRLVPDLAVSHVGPAEVMIRNKATGLNHIDWMSVEYNFCLPELPWVTGREMAGVVEAVGAGVARLKPGDVVWTTTYYRDRRAGCFQDLVIVPEHTVFPIPPTLDFHTAACLGVAGVTAAMTLWCWLKVPMAPVPVPTSSASAASPKPDVLLVWGGSTVTGQFSIQLAAHAGLEVVAVCSAATAGLVKRRGAAHVVTYSDKTEQQIIDEILGLSGGRLNRAIDLVGPKTAGVVLETIAQQGARHGAPVPVDFCPLAFMPKDAVVPAHARVHTVEIKQFVLNRASGVYGERLNELVAAGVVQVPEVRVLEGGLGAVEKGLAMVREGNLGGRKLVVSFGP